MGDAFPVSPGHSLIVPRRHIGSFFELRPEEREALLALLDQARDALQRSHQPQEGYNIGINDGPAAGQTVPHLHIHLIPRYSGDLPDPRGAVGVAGEGAVLVRGELLDVGEFTK